MFVVFCLYCKQKTAYEVRISDWSSDVCSSDLRSAVPRTLGRRDPSRGPHRQGRIPGGRFVHAQGSLWTGHPPNLILLAPWRRDRHRLPAIMRAQLALRSEARATPVAFPYDPRRIAARPLGGSIDEAAWPQIGRAHV